MADRVEDKGSFPLTWPRYVLCYRFKMKILTLKQRVVGGCGSAREFLRRGFDVSWWLDMSLQEGDAGR